MRIVSVTHFFESHGGGIERVAGHLCRNLAGQGHDAVWAASACDPPPYDHAIAAVPLGCVNPTERLTGLPMPVPGPAAIAALAHAISRADAVIVHDALYCTSIAAAAIARARRKPVILIQHIAEIPFASRMLRTVMQSANALVTRPMLRTADQVVFISETVRRSFADVTTKRPAKLLFNGVDGSIFHPGPSAGERLGLPPAGRVVAFVGRFVEKKGLAVLQACAARHRDTTFVMAGEGPLDPAGWNLPNIVLAGPLQPRDVAALFRSADALVLPSVGEGFPMVIQEAMACGLPVICGIDSARADPDAGRWLRGVAIDLNQPEDTASRVAAALDANQLARTDRKAMAGYAARAYSWPAMATRIAEMAESMLNARVD